MKRMEDDVFKKHLGKHQGMKIREDTIYLKPLGIKYGPDLLTFQVGMMNGMTDELIQKFNNADKEEEFGVEEMKAVFGNMDQKTKEAMYGLVEATLKKSYPEKWGTVEGRTDLEEFGLKYGLPLAMEIMKINSAKDMESVKKTELLEKINRKK